ncbi:MAG: hypothetical protein H6Q17_2020 [Bacteroidetes bacterium]|jgi:hypothetical protein|nr:hypothetical protein [Bacteroidota bacterium]
MLACRFKLSMNVVVILNRRRNRATLHKQTISNILHLFLLHFCVKHPANKRIKNVRKLYNQNFRDVVCKT